MESKMVTREEHAKIKELWSSGYSKSQISRLLGRKIDTVSKYIKLDKYPGYRLTAKKSSKLDAYKGYILERLLENSRISEPTLQKELVKKGYSGKRGILFDYLKLLKKELGLASGNVKTRKILPGDNTSSHQYSYRRELKSNATGGNEMAGNRVDSALSEYRKMYKAASKLEKGRILDDFCKITKYHRKYAIELLGKDDTGIKVVKTRPPIYSKEALFVVERIWEMADYPWSERLVIQIPLWLPSAKQHMKWITPEMEQEVLSISARQIDRRLKQKKKKLL